MRTQSGIKYSFKRLGKPINVLTTCVLERAEEGDQVLTIHCL